MGHSVPEWMLLSNEEHEEWRLPALPDTDSAISMSHAIFSQPT